MTWFHSRNVCELVIIQIFVFRRQDKLPGQLSLEDKSEGAQRWRMSPNGNGFVRVESADSMEEPLLSPGFTSTVERPVEDLLVSVRAPH